MDNLSVHHSLIVKKEFDNPWFHYQFLPPQSYELNPIEKVWNVVKNQWRRTSFLILENNHKTDEKIADAVRMIQGIAEGMDVEKMKKVARSNYKSMSLTLRGLLV